MLSGTLQQKVEDYKEIYTLLKNELRWRISDKRTMMLIASMYVVNDQTFHLQKFLTLSEYIKGNVGLFSTLRSNQRFTTAAMLDVHFEDPKEKFHDLLDVYEKLKQEGFGRGTFTMIAALTMLVNNENTPVSKEKIKRALSIYNGMRDEHFFLTSKSDYPLAVLLAEVEGSVDELMDHIEFFYKNLSSHNFKKGNNLQFLSHILALDRDTDADVLIERCVSLVRNLQRKNMTVKRMYYPEFGLLALLKDSDNEIEKIQQMVNELDRSKLFKWHKDMNFIITVNLLISDKMNDTTLVETGMYIYDNRNTYTSPASSYDCCNRCSRSFSIL